MPFGMVIFFFHFIHLSITTHTHTQAVDWKVQFSFSFCFVLFFITTTWIENNTFISSILEKYWTKSKQFCMFLYFGISYHNEIYINLMIAINIDKMMVWYIVRFVIIFQMEFLYFIFMFSFSFWSFHKCKSKQAKWSLNDDDDDCILILPKKILFFTLLFCSSNSIYMMDLSRI